jgi:chromosome segregation ATPase
MEALSERKLEESPRTFGRDGQVCPACWNELEARCADLERQLAERDEQISELENELTAGVHTCGPNCQRENCYRGKYLRKEAECERLRERFDQASEWLHKHHEQRDEWQARHAALVERVLNLNAEIDAYWNDASEACIDSRARMPEFYKQTITNAQIALADALRGET